MEPSGSTYSQIDHSWQFFPFRIIANAAGSLTQRIINLFWSGVPHQTQEGLQQKPSVHDYLVQLRLFFSQGDSEKIIEQQAEQNFVGEVTDLPALLRQILIDLERSFPIYLEEKDLREEAKTADKLQEIFSGKNEPLARFLNHRFLSDNMIFAISDLCPKCFSDIYVVQVEKEELKQVVARVCSDEEEMKQLIEGAEYVRASFGVQDSVVYKSRQVIKIFCEQMPTEALAYLFMDTYYENKTFTRVYEKLFIPPQPLDEVETEEDYVNNLNSLLLKPIILESKRDEESFLAEVNGKPPLSFDEHIKKIQKELELNEISIYLNGRALSDLIREKPLKDLLKEEKIAPLLHRAALFSYAQICKIFTNPTLDIHMQPHINQQNCQIHVRLDSEGTITFSAYQVVKIGFFGQKKISDLKICTRYEKGQLRVVVEKG